MKEPCDSSALPSSVGVHRELGMRWEAPKVRLAEIKHMLQTWITHVSCAVWNKALLPLISVGFEYNQHLAQQRLKYKKKPQQKPYKNFLIYITLPSSVNQAEQEISKLVV